MPATQPASPDQPQPAAPCATPANHADYYRGVLHELIAHGVDLVRCLAAQANAEPVPHPFWGDKAPVAHPTEHIAIAYDRITRSIRRSITLAQTLDEPPRRIPARGAHPTPLLRAVPGPDERPGLSPRERPASDSPTREPSAPEFDRPDDGPEFAADAARPIAEIVREIEADLGAATTPLPIRQSASPRPAPPTDAAPGSAAATRQFQTTPGHGVQPPSQLPR